MLMEEDQRACLPKQMPRQLRGFQRKLGQQGMCTALCIAGPELIKIALRSNSIVQNLHLMRTLATLDRFPQHCTMPKVHVPSCRSTACQSWPSVMLPSCKVCLVVYFKSLMGNSVQMQTLSGTCLHHRCVLLCNLLRADWEAVPIITLWRLHCECFWSFPVCQPGSPLYISPEHLSKCWSVEANKAVFLEI